jgi:hypothetical protein
MRINTVIRPLPKLKGAKFHTVAGKAIGFALEQPLHVVAFA